jgi:hypothetical protein
MCRVHSTITSFHGKLSHLLICDRKQTWYTHFTSFKSPFYVDRCRPHVATTHGVPIEQLVGQHSSNTNLHLSLNLWFGIPHMGPGPGRNSACTSWNPIHKQEGPCKLEFVVRDNLHGAWAGLQPSLYLLESHSQAGRAMQARICGSG